jgi:hypothetical protein
MTNSMGGAYRTDVGSKRKDAAVHEMTRDSAKGENLLTMFDFTGGYGYTIWRTYIKDTHKARRKE